MRRKFILVVFAVGAAGCGESGEQPPPQTVHESILIDRAASNGCLVPGDVGWTDSRASLSGGVTGDVCSFEGGAADGAKLSVCINQHLLVESRGAAPDQTLCTADNGHPAAPVPSGPGCAESCLSSAGAVVSCLSSPARPPSRQLSTPWPLSAAADCDALMSGCPEVGDPCTGASVCSAFWHPNQPAANRSFSGFDAMMWCDHGALAIVITD